MSSVRSLAWMQSHLQSDSSPVFLPNGGTANNQNREVFSAKFLGDLAVVGVVSRLFVLIEGTIELFELLARGQGQVNENHFVATDFAPRRLASVEQFESHGEALSPGVFGFQPQSLDDVGGSRHRGRISVHGGTRRWNEGEGEAGD